MVELNEGEYVGLRLARLPEIPIDQAKKEWKEVILAAVKGQGKETIPGAPFITITMPCGSHIEYQNFEDIPDEDVPCDCGNPKHWFIQHVLTVKVSKN